METTRIPRFAIFVAVAALCACGAGPDPETRDQEPGAAVQWHSSVLDQLKDAWAERDLERMQNLLEQPRAGALDEQLQSYRTFETLFETGLVQQGGFEVKGFRLLAAESLDGGRLPPDLEMQQTAPMELRMQPAPGRSYRVPKSRENGAVTRFMLTTRFEDWRADGSVSRSASPYRFAAQRDLVLTHDKPFVLPLPSTPAAPADVLIRLVRIEGALLCASFVAEDTELAISRLELEPLEYAQFARGFRESKVRSAPLEVLKVAATAPARFASHLLTASWFLARDFDAATRQKALPMLIEALRSGAGADKTVRAALLLVAGEENAPALRDRDGWLRWWDLRARTSK